MRTASLVALALAGFFPRHARAEEAASRVDRPLPPPPTPSDEIAGTEFKPAFTLDTGRIPRTRPVGFGFEIHGEYQLRASLSSPLRLEPMPGRPDTAQLDRRTYVEHWLRITPRLALSRDVEIVAQLDAPRGFIEGQRQEFVNSPERTYDERRPFGVDPRWLFIEWRGRGKSLRVGQQPSHWGMGLAINDGDHPSLFGDYAGGTRVERVLLTLQPAQNFPFALALAGDVVFKDARADLTNRELAVQGLAAAYYTDKANNRVGLYGAYRHQRQTPDGLPTGIENTILLDSAGRFTAKIPGLQGHVSAEYEIAYILGESDLTRPLLLTGTPARDSVRALGAATRLGFVHTAGTGAERFGRWVMQLEWGWASGDAKPEDGTFKRFRFDPNYNVGLILFDQVLAFKTARARAIMRGRDSGTRAGPGADSFASDGSVFGATYLNPTFVLRPLRELDLKAGVVIAQTTADFVDPVGLAMTGSFQNYDGATTHNRDLGVELDGGFEYRCPLVPSRLTAELGAQGGVFFPGTAFNDAAGNRLGTQYLAVGRFGLQY